MRDSFGLVEAVLYVIAAISGGLGGSMVAGHAVLRGRSISLMIGCAYLVIGAVFGVLSLAFASALGIEVVDVDALVGNAVVAGAAASVTLASTNLSVRWVLKRLGVEVEMTVRRRNEDRRRRGDDGGADGEHY